MKSKKPASYKSGQATKNDKSGSAAEDALTLESGTGGAGIVHGLAVDTFARSIATCMIPWYVRDTLFRAWHGMAGRRVDYSATTLPWYTFDVISDFSAEITDENDCVAKRLTVTVQDAEAWGRGDQTNAFGRYADVPMNPLTISRWSFWRYDPLAAELDPKMAFEPQIVALDAFSQLFTESASFHFGFLADVDREYHRLRSKGPLGRLDADSAREEAWYNLYHYWRDELESTYVNSPSNPDGLVVMPQHLRDGNWTIADVLNELYAMMTTTGGQLLPEIVITGRGYSKGLQSITLGVQDDAAYHDADGNTRFYMPYMEMGETSTATLSHAAPTFAFDKKLTGYVGDTDDSPFVPADSVDYDINSIVTSDVNVAPMWAAYAEQTHSLDTPQSWFRSLLSFQQSQKQPSGDYIIPGPSRLPSASFAPTDATGLVMTDFMSIRDVPRDGVLDGKYYWSGHTLNFAQMIKFAMEIGRGLEPEVLENMILPMDVVSSAEAFVRRPQGSSIRQIDELYNLYESGFSFNENPARTYTAAHLGPTNHMLDTGDLTIAGTSIETKMKGKLVTARERYWTPTVIDSTNASKVSAAFFPGVSLETTLYRNLDIQQLATFDNARLRDFISRTLGDIDSMRTKVERPIYLPAGKSGPETTYASGMGVGALQLVSEMLLALSGSAPRYGLGHHGFTDVKMRESIPGSGNFDTLNRRIDSVGQADSAVTILSPAHMGQDGRVLTLLADSGSYDENTLDSVVAASKFSPTLGSQIPYMLDSDQLGFNMSQHLLRVDPLAASVTNNRLNDIIATHLPRGFYGGVDNSPVHTVQTSMNGGHDFWTYGARMIGNNAFKKGLPNGTNQSIFRSQGSSGDVLTYDLYKVPTSMQVRFNGRTFDIPLGVNNPIKVAYYPHANSGVSATHIFSDVNTDQTIYQNFRDYSWGIDGNTDGVSQVFQGINSNGTWKNSLYTEFGRLDVTSSALEPEHTPNVRVLVPRQSLTDVMQAGFAVACAAYGNESEWRFDLTEADWVKVTVTEYLGKSPTMGPGNLTQNLSSEGYISDWQTGSVSGKPAAPVAAPVYSESVHTFECVQPSAAELNLAATRATVKCSLTAPGQITMEKTLEPVFQDGVAWKYESSTSSVGIACKLPFASGDTAGLNVTTVYGIGKGSHLRKMAGTWGVPHVDVTRDLSPWVSTPDDGEIQSVIPMRLPGTSPFASVVPWQCVMGSGLAPTGQFGAANSSAPDVASFSLLSTAAFGGDLGGMAKNGSVTYNCRSLYWAPGLVRTGSVAPGVPINRHTYGLVSEVGAQLTYIYPDLPDHKMVYRPWRRIADASILKELRLIFDNDGEDPSFAAGPLGIKTFGTRGQFRLAELVDAGKADTFVLEQASSKTRLISPSHRSVLTFSKLQLLDPNSQRHTIPDVVHEANQVVPALGGSHFADTSGNAVITRQSIRELQLGRQYQNL